LILLSHQNVIVYNTSGVAPAKLPRTNCEFYSERRTGAGVYVPTPGAPQPIIKDIFPQNDSQDISLNPTLCVHLIDFHYDLMNLTISTNVSGSWSILTTLHDIGNGWYNFTTTQMNQRQITYYWRVSAIDPYADKLNTTHTYKFTTLTPPVIKDILAYPSQVLPGGSLNISCNVTDNSYVNLVKTNITYPDGHTTNTTSLGGEPRWNVLTYDDFESGFGNFTDGGSDCLLYTGSTYSYQGNKAGEIRDYNDINSSFFLTESRDIDTPRYTSLTVDFWFKAHDLERRENLWVKYYDGIHWQLVADYLEERDFQNDVFYHKIIWINETNYVFPKDMKIRFQCDASDDSDNIYIDQIFINATMAQGPKYYYNNTYIQKGIYHYFIWANDRNGNINSSVSNFFKIGDNLPPYISGNPNPSNGSINNPLSFTWSIPMNDYEGDPFSWVIHCNNGQMNSRTNDTNGTKSLVLHGLNTSTLYIIWVNATDPTGSHLYTNTSFSFMTRENLPPIFGSPAPTNGSNNNPLSLSWSILINDSDGDRFSWTIQCSNGQGTSGTNASNGIKLLPLSGLGYSITYKVWVNATDATGSGLFVRKWFIFTTKSSDDGSGGGQQPPSEPENKKPLANASAGEPYRGVVNSEITFDGSRSYDPDGNIMKWLWVFGDDTNKTGKIVQHIYYKTGSYNVTLSVTDDEGATNTVTTICIIKQQNRPPTPPIITGSTDGTKNTTYTYTAVSTDADNDTMMYTFDWKDPLNSPQSSGFLPNGKGFTISHSWSAAGRYNIMVTVTDNQTQSFSKFTVYIDAVQTGDIGYLLDNDGDGIYDVFYSDILKQTTLVQNKNGVYVIDSDGNGVWDYTFDMIKGLASYQEPPNTPGFELVIAISAIVLAILWRRNLKEEN
jgi:PKD repeat protein